MRVGRVSALSCETMKDPSKHHTDTHRPAIPLLVAYDIPENARRGRLHRLLKGFGEPIQKSVFVCWVDHARRRRLQQALEAFMRAPHKGTERIDCIPARAVPVAGLPQAWVCESTARFISTGTAPRWVVRMGA